MGADSAVGELISAAFVIPCTRLRCCRGSDKKLEEWSWGYLHKVVFRYPGRTYRALRHGLRTGNHVPARTRSHLRHGRKMNFSPMLSANGSMIVTCIARVQCHLFQRVLRRKGRQLRTPFAEPPASRLRCTPSTNKTCA